MSKSNREVMASLEAAGLRPHSAAVFYQQNTSDIKDDLPQLINIMKNDSSPGGHMTRQEASFLLWYHSLCDGGERSAELLSQGLVSACLQVLVDSKAKTPDRTCATGILMTLCTTDKHSGTGACDQVVRSKAGSSTAFMLLHDLLQSGDNMRSYAAHCLQCIAEEPQARSSMIRAMDGKLHFLPLYMSMVTQSTNILAASSVALFLAALLRGQRTLVGEALANGIIEAVMHGLRRHKLDRLVRHCADLLTILLENHQSWDRVVNYSDFPNAGPASGLRLLVDLLGPPPEAIMRHESLHYSHVLHPEKAEQEARKKAEEVQAALEEKAQNQNAEGQNISPRVPFGQRKFTGGRAVSKAFTLKLDRQNTNGSEAAKEKAKVVQVMDAENSYQEARRDTPEAVPPRTLEQLFSHNSAALQWKSIVSTQTRATVAGCLYTLAQSTDHMHTMSALLATSRLVPLINAIMSPPDEGKNKKSKPSGKNKLRLSVEDTNSLVNITGALKVWGLRVNKASGHECSCVWMSTCACSGFWMIGCECSGVWMLECECSDFWTTNFKYSAVWIIICDCSGV
uniref:Uncharacterized protein n=1 Tax=Dunaliella tertiolecta TaxID=3047 RepID=A0A7S3QRV7_DUNTE